MRNYGAKQAIDDFPGLPDELMRFLERDTYSLIIKGAAGTGKTTLALTILRALGIKRNCLYISTRTFPGQLFDHHPWLERFFGEPKSLLITSSKLSTELPVFVDARLEESSSIFEMITNKLMDTKAPMLIIDTWDAIASLMDKEALISNSRVLETWRRRAVAKLILVVEQDSDATFDFLADGMIQLKQEYFNGRRIREILFPKIRGVRINKPSYIFTLNNSIFKSYEPYNPADFAINSDWTISTQKVKRAGLKRKGSFITTGYNELDSLLQGGFPAKGIVNIELDPNVNPKVAVVFLSNVISNFVRTNNLVLFHPFEGLDQDYVNHYLRSSFSISPTRALVKSSGHNNKASDQITIERTNMTVEKRLESFQETISKMKKGRPNKLLLNIMGSDAVQRVMQVAANHAESVTTFLRSNTELSIIVSRRSQDPEYISGISDIYLKITDVKGTLFLEPQKPWSNLYAIVIKKHLGHPSIRLEPLI